MIYRGGKDEERLYLHDLKFDCGDDICIVKKTDMPDLDNIIARHFGRYHLPATFCRPGMDILDFPCGSGYGYSILHLTGARYEGRDNDPVSIEYAKNFYRGAYCVDDLTNPSLPDRTYGLIACIEGLEHIEQHHQARLVKYFHEALVHGGILVITTPERGEQITNPYHKWELKRDEFQNLLQESFSDVQILSQRDTNHKGEKTNFLYGICRRED